MITIGRELGWATKYANVADPLQAMSKEWSALRFHIVWEATYKCFEDCGQRELVNGSIVAIAHDEHNANIHVPCLADRLRHCRLKALERS
jgi:hypothetical protein